MAFWSRLKRMPHKRAILGVVLVAAAVTAVVLSPPLWIPAVVVGVVGIGAMVSSGVRAYYQRKQTAHMPSPAAAPRSLPSPPVSTDPEEQAVLEQMQICKSRLLTAGVKGAPQGIPEFLGLPAEAALSDCIKACRQLMLYWNADQNNGIKKLYARSMGDADRAAVHTIVEFLRTLHSELKEARNNHTTLHNLPCWRVGHVGQAVTEAEMESELWADLLRRYAHTAASLANTERSYDELIATHRRLLGYPVEESRHTTADMVAWQRPVASRAMVRAQADCVDAQIAAVDRKRAEWLVLKEEVNIFYERWDALNVERVAKAEERATQAAAKVARLTAENTRLLERLAWFERQQYGSTAESDDPRF